jgi:hypothetical protein
MGQKIIFLLFILFTTSSFIENQSQKNSIFSINKEDYKAIFKKDYTNAEQTINKLETQFSKQFPAKKRIAQAIIFPELIRYNLFRDLLETESLKLIYVEQGSEMIDFSIGLFQMKPSFVEKIEMYLQNNSVLLQNNSSLSKIPHFDFSTIEKIRKQRIERLQQTDWQLLYLSAFIDICFHRFEHLATLSDEKQVVFLAAAYNTGFDKSIQQIEKAANRKIFPYGTAFGEDQHAYTQISLSYYLSQK